MKHILYAFTGHIAAKPLRNVSNGSSLCTFFLKKKICLSSTLISLNARGYQRYKTYF